MPKSEPRIVIIGAGSGGLTCAIALQQRYGYTNFTIYEKASDVGGTWRSNIYPGCSSDVTMPFYCLSTELRNWPASHLPQPEILAYWVEIAQKHNLYPHIVFNQIVTTAEWNPATQLYDIVLTDTETKAQTASTAHIVISAVGILDSPRYASIPGLDNFKGDLFHSGRWDYSKELAGRRVGVIGNGASATQFVPIIVQDRSTQVLQFCREPTWMLPNLGKRYSIFRRTLFRWFPFMMRLSRMAHFIMFEGMYTMIFAIPATRWILTKLITKYMIAMSPQKYHDNIIPKYVLGCKRVVFDSNYLKSLHSPNLQLNYDGIESIVADGIVTKTGEHIPLDVMIFATGYTADKYPISIKGSKNQTIQEYFEEQGGPKAYLGTTVPRFPNFFIIYGPNINTGHTSVIWTNEVQVNYIMQLIQPIIEHKAISIEVREDATDAYDAKVQAKLSKAVYAYCSSWYRVGGTGKIINAFPGASSTLYMWLRKPDWSHFSGIGAEAWIRKKRQAEYLRSLGRVALAVALVMGAYNYKVLEAEGIQPLKGWMEAGALQLVYLRHLFWK